MIGILLSIIIPVYNVADYVGKTLTSLEEQTNKNFELIIVDDGSIDSSLEVVRERLQAGNISRYSIIEQEKMQELVLHRNKGFEKAEGEYVLFLDGDDYIGSNLVERLSTVTRECSPDIICWGFDKVLKDGKSIDVYSLKYRNKPEVMMTGLEALTNMVVKKTCIYGQQVRPINANLLLKLDCNILLDVNVVKIWGLHIRHCPEQIVYCT